MGHRHMKYIDWIKFWNYFPSKNMRKNHTVRELFSSQFWGFIYRNLVSFVQVYQVECVIIYAQNPFKMESMISSSFWFLSLLNSLQYFEDMIFSWKYLPIVKPMNYSSFWVWSVRWLTWMRIEISHNVFMWNSGVIWKALYSFNRLKEALDF